MHLLMIMVMCVFSPLWAHITIKPIAIVQQDKIVVSDLFDGLEKEDLRVVRDAPLPGKRVVLDFKQIKAVAQQMGIVWEPLTDHARITVKRDAYKMPERQLLQLIRDAIQANDDQVFDDEHADVVLHKGNPAIYLPKEKESDVEVVDIQFSERKNHFSATVKTPYETVVLQGYIDKMVDVPVLKNVMKRGEVISETDIETIRIPLKEVGRAILIKGEDIIGHRVRSGQCPAFQPLYNHQLEVVHHVAKGNIVSMIVHVHGVEITGKGKALESGQLNDVIRVENIDSHKVVLAQVTGEKTVEVQRLANHYHQGSTL